MPPDIEKFAKKSGKRRGKSGKEEKSGKEGKGLPRDRADYATDLFYRTIIYAGIYELTVNICVHSRVVFSNKTCLES